MAKTASSVRTRKGFRQSSGFTAAPPEVESKPMNRNLAAAKAAKQDEFYTQYVDIQKEVEAYLEFDPDTFRGKVVYCNCDDPFESNFFKYFAANFNKLGLAKLVTTSYDGSPPPETSAQMSVQDQWVANSAGVISARLYGISDGTLSFVGGSSIRGRLFDTRDHSRAEPVVLLSEPLAVALFGTTEAEGRTIFWRHDRVPQSARITRSSRVVGVVRTPAIASAKSPPRLEHLAFSPLAQGDVSALTIAATARSGNGAGIVGVVEQAVRRADPVLAIAVAGAGDRLAGAQVVVARLVAAAAGSIAALALLFSMSSLYAVLSDIIALRQREMALRVALGGRRERYSRPWWGLDCARCGRDC
jgi:hypothetical protein